jgi:hypothetical protein
LLLDERLKPGVHVREAFAGEPAAGMADVDKVVSFVHAEHQRPEVGTAAPWPCESADHRLLALPPFNLQPGVGSGARPVTAGGILGDGPFQALSRNRPEERNTPFFYMLAHPNQAIVVNDFVKKLLPLEKGQ